MSEFQKDELSLEETNKLRISLGLKPLVDDGPSAPAPASPSAPTQEDPDQVAARNYAEKTAREKREREETDLKERLARAQTRRELARSMQGPTLADPDGADKLDTLKWLKQSKKRAKEHAARRAKELEEQEQQALADYSEADLAGLKVAHDADDFGDGEERILTLRDTRVLDDGEDELMDQELDQAERDRDNLERKKGAKKYTGLDDYEFAPETVGKSRGVLAKYDADLDENDRLLQSEDSGFRLGASSRPNRKEQARKEQEQAALAANKQLLSLDYTKNQQVSDYLQEGDVGFKKPKTKKRKKAAKVRLDFDDDREEQQAGPSSSVAPQPMEEDEPAITVRKPRARETDNFVDDDELQASLAKARRQKAKRTFNKMTPEMIAKNMAAQREAEQAEKAANGTANGTANGSVKDAQVKAEDDGAGLTFDETSEFVRNINHRAAANVVEEDEREQQRRRRQQQQELSANATQVKREDSAEARATGETQPTPAARVTVKKEEDEDAEMAYSSGSEADAAAEPEPTVGRGMASTLAILRNQGMLPTASEEEKRRDKAQREYDRWLAERRHEEHIRELERQLSKAQGSSKDQATREYENKQRELEEARRAQERFRNYKPDVEIKYHDEFGRELEAREAWKQLSHVFHGKKPGAKKQEKRLRKIAEEQKKARMAAGDTPTGMIRAFQSRAERSGQAHMVLSVGNRSSAPQEPDLLAPPAARPAAAAKRSASASRSESVTVEGGSGLSSAAEQSGTVSADDARTPVPVSTTTTTTTTTAPRTTGGGWTAVGRSKSSTPAPATAPTPAESVPTLAPALAPAPAPAAAAAAAPAQPKFKLAFGTKRKEADAS